MTTLVVGGAASGKSEYAEHLTEAAYALAGRETPLWYIATMQAPDDESRARVTKHRDRRAGKGYETAECPDVAALTVFAERLASEPSNLTDRKPVILLDDFGNLVANELFAPERVEEALARSEPRNTPPEGRHAGPRLERCVRGRSVGRPRCGQLHALPCAAGPLRCCLRGQRL